MCNCAVLTGLENLLAAGLGIIDADPCGAAVRLAPLCIGRQRYSGHVERSMDFGDGLAELHGTLSRPSASVSTGWKSCTNRPVLKSC